MWQVNRQLTSIAIVNALPRPCFEMCFAALAIQESLTHLDLRSNFLEDHGTLLLAKYWSSFRSQRTLVELDVSDNSIGDVGFHALVRTLFADQAWVLTHLRAATNRISDAAIQTLAQLMAAHQSNPLVAIDLEQNNLTGEGFDKLAQSLQSSRHVTRLSLRDNKFVDMTKLVQAMALHPSLADVNLSQDGRDHMKPKGMSELAVLLGNKMQTPKQLVKLDLRHLEMDVETLNTLCRSMRKNMSVTELHVRVDDARSVRLDDQIADSIAEMLRRNVVLKTLTIVIPCLNKKLISRIISAWLLNAGLQSLEMKLGDSHFLFDDTTFPQLQDRLAFRKIVKQPMQKLPMPAAVQDKVLQNSKFLVDVSEFGDRAQWKEIGAGNFGTVYCITFRGQPYALKARKSDDSRDSRRKNEKQLQQIQEVAIIHQLEKSTVESLSKLCVFPIVFSTDTDGSILMVLPLMTEGGLDDYLKKCVTQKPTDIDPDAWDQQSNADLTRVMQDVGMALQQLHAAGVVHRDVAVRNILLNFKAGGSSRLEARLADFGLASNRRYPCDPPEFPVAIWPVDLLRRTRQGHLEFEYTMSGDVYEFGLLIASIQFRLVEFRSELWKTHGHKERPFDVATMVVELRECEECAQAADEASSVQPQSFLRLGHIKSYQLERNASTDNQDEKIAPNEQAQVMSPVVLPNDTSDYAQQNSPSGYRPPIDIGDYAPCNGYQKYRYVNRYAQYTYRTDYERTTALLDESEPRNPYARPTAPTRHFKRSDPDILERIDQFVKRGTNPPLATLIAWCTRYSSGERPSMCMVSCLLQLSPSRPLAELPDMYLEGRRAADREEANAPSDWLFLAELLCTDRNLHVIDWHSVNLNSWGVDCVAAVLNRSESLTSLDLCYNRIGQNISVMADALRKNTTLKTLKLSGNRLGDQGAERLVRALLQHGALTHLSLQNNEIRDQGARALAELLRKNNKITHLHVDANNIGSPGQQALENALSTNTSVLEYTGPGHLLALEARRENRRQGNQLDFSKCALQDQEFTATTLGFVAYFIKAKYEKLLPEVDHQADIAPVVVEKLTAFVGELRTISTLSLHGSLMCICWCTHVFVGRHVTAPICFVRVSVIFHHRDYRQQHRSHFCKNID
jgi:serine/threonine protein kinase/Ran GTPase-activating protein (RanGAP) involved in mRNA processing and transport